MFDIGFLEIMVILIIALLVIGPERMPEVARKLGKFMGKMRNFINQMKEDSPLKDTVQEVRDAMDLEEQKKNISNISKELEHGLNFDDSGLDLDELQRPFGGDTNQPSSSQFNKAPSQPNLPQADQSAEKEKTESVDSATPPPEKEPVKEKQTDTATAESAPKDNKNS